MSKLKGVVVTNHAEKDRRKARLHLSMVRGLSRYFDMIMYHDYSYNAISMFDKHRPDFVLCYSSYSLPQGYLKGVPCLKIILETDYYKRVRNDDFSIYHSNDFDAIFRRGFGHCEIKPDGIPIIFLPYSADYLMFYPDDRIHREKIIGFAGTINAPVYDQRNLAIGLLEDAGYLRNAGRTLKDYPQFLRSMQGFLASAELGSPYGKTFEVLASKTTLLSPDFIGRKELFGDVEFFVEYLPDCSNLVPQAKKILHDCDYANEVANVGYTLYKDKHTHTHRVQELYTNIVNLLEGKEVKHFWDI